MRLFAVSILFASAVVFAGCSSDDEPAAASAKPVVIASGTRLHAKLVIGGGAREVVGFYDSQRNEDCTFQRAEEGRMRCLPSTAPYAGIAAFSDAACTLPLVSVQQSACEDAPKYALSYRADGSCTATPMELRKLLAAAGPRYTGGSTQCTLQPGTPPPSAAPFFALGDVVPWTDFVEAQETTVPGDPVSETVLVGSDGARQHLGFRSEGLAAACSFQLMADGVMRCVPDGGRGTVFYTDALCSKPSFVESYVACSDNAGRFWAEPSGNASCTGVRAVYSVSAYRGPETGDSGELYSQQFTSTQACTFIGKNTGGASTAQRRSVDADITSSLPTTERVGSGSERLVPALVVERNNPALVPGWHDTERDVDCAFARASDGKLRCLPTATPARVFFTDATCKSPSLVAVLSEIPCTGLSRFVLVPNNTCPTATRVYELRGDPHNLPSASTETSPGRCAALAGVNGAYDVTEVDPTQFVEGLPLPE